MFYHVVCYIILCVLKQCVMSHVIIYYIMLFYPNISHFMCVYIYVCVYMINLQFYIFYTTAHIFGVGAEWPYFRAIYELYNTI